uniref:Uncharacterized protein n=1 Tax=Glossina austeni TaxID=7395 RepID=A0A1A9UDP6_GLOAU
MACNFSNALADLTVAFMTFSGVEYLGLEMSSLVVAALAAMFPIVKDAVLRFPTSGGLSDVFPIVMLTTFAPSGASVPLSIVAFFVLFEMCFDPVVGIVALMAVSGFDSNVSVLFSFVVFDDSLFKVFTFVVDAVMSLGLASAQGRRLFLYHINACPVNNSIIIFGISVSGISSVPQSSSICSTNSSGFVTPSYLTDHLRTRSIASLLDINSEAARMGLVARDPVSSTVNVVRGVYLDSSSSRRSIVSLLGLVEPAIAPNAFRISSTVFNASRPSSAQAAVSSSFLRL